MNAVIHFFLVLAFSLYLHPRDCTTPSSLAALQKSRSELKRRLLEDVDKERAAEMVQTPCSSSIPLLC